MLAPCFDIYFHQIKLAGGEAQVCPLRVVGEGDTRGASACCSWVCSSDAHWTMVGAEWQLDLEEFEACFKPNTRVVLLNTPHNPTGKVTTRACYACLVSPVPQQLGVRLSQVFSRAELEAIAAIIVRHPDVVVLADEVYEHIVFDGHEHVHIASLPDMYEPASRLPPSVVALC